jgi:hypothetical protein
MKDKPLYCRIYDPHLKMRVVHAILLRGKRYVAVNMITGRVIRISKASVKELGYIL